MTLPDPDHIPLRPGRPQRSIATSAIVIYATLILLAITIPRGLVNWSRNFDPNPLQEALYSFALTVQQGSRQLGLDQPYVHGRALFLKLTGKPDD